MAGIDVPGVPTPGFDPAAWFGSTFFLEESKLAPPALRPGTVPRAGLLARLRASDVPVVSVAAPAGYGKSALLRQWADGASHRVAWLSLEREDNDPAVLLAYIAAALDRLGPIDATVLRTRAKPGTSVAAIVARRIAATLSSLAGPVALVLDHTEVLDNPQCRDAIAELALHLPPTARLVLASRGNPPLPLAALRARGAVVEVGPDDLAMDRSEADDLLRAAGVQLGADELAELIERTEGWAVGIYLAGLAVKAGGRRQGGGVAFTGDDRLMADYLRSELLSRVPRGRVTFLTRTSVLERMCGPLCDAVLGRTRSGPLLEVLEGSNLLLVPLDRRREWYRYHRLFQELLRAELDRREGELVVRLHERAAAWCEANGLPDMAIGHAQAAGDADLVARLVAQHVVAAYAGGRLETAVRWLQWFDERDLVERFPPIAVVGAVLLSIIGQAGAAERWAVAAERAPVEGTVPDGSPLASWQALLRAWLCRKGTEQMRRDAASARAGLVPASRWRPIAVALEGMAWLADGEPERADPILAHAVELALDIGALPLAQAALAERALVAISRGDWEDAEAFVAQGLGLVQAGHLEDYGPAALVHAVAARTAAHRGDVDRARTSIAQANRLRPQLTYLMPVVSVQMLLEIGRAYLALADGAGARVVLREARDILRQRPDLGVLRREADELHAALDKLRVGAMGASSLTNAELRLVPLLSTHLSFRAIGERLHVSRHTVKTQAISVYRKLGVTSRSDAIARAQEIGLLG